VGITVEDNGSRKQLEMDVVGSEDTNSKESDSNECGEHFIAKSGRE
jgi:hypothetical protein